MIPKESPADARDSGRWAIRLLGSTASDREWKLNGIRRRSALPESSLPLIYLTGSQNTILRCRGGIRLSPTGSRHGRQELAATAARPCGSLPLRPGHLLSGFLSVQSCVMVLSVVRTTSPREIHIGYGRVSGCSSPAKTPFSKA